MSTTEKAAPAEEQGEAPEADHDEHMHPSDWKYVQIAIILAVLTAAEVATYYIDTGPLEIPILITLMIVKFVLVVMWFMHLKFDSPLFTKTFVAGLAMAVVVYVAVLATFEYWAR